MIEITCGDCLEVLPTISDSERPRLIFCDPPYNQGVDYGQGPDEDKLSPGDYRLWINQLIFLCTDILLPNGSLWMMMPQEHQASAYLGMERAGLHFRNTITWHETFGVNCTKKFSRTSRPIHYFTKHPTNFIFNADSVRVPSDRQLKYSDSRANPDGKVPGDVWEISRVCGTFRERIPEFPTQLPLKLLRRIVEVASDPNDIVLDPTCGSGTTLEAAKELGRQGIGIELNSSYADMARKRIGDYAPLFTTTGT